MFNLLYHHVNISTIRRFSYTFYSGLVSQEDESQKPLVIKQQIKGYTYATTFLSLFPYYCQHITQTVQDKVQNNSLCTIQCSIFTCCHVIGLALSAADIGKVRSEKLKLVESKMSLNP